jgi:quinol monooxygenase YgiN
MTEHIHWMLEVAIIDGQAEAFRVLMAEMVDATQADEPGALNYEWYISEDEQTCHIYERYADSAATMIHLQNFGTKFAQRFMGAVRPTRIVVYGNASDTVRQALAPMGAVHMMEIGGFTRSA